MKIAVISDIHSNSFALSPVLDDVSSKNVKGLIILGDVFGYYPWAVETYDLLEPYLASAYCIKGNHDQLLRDCVPPRPVPSYWGAAEANRTELLARRPEALSWLSTLEAEKYCEIDGLKIRLVHGTPDDLLMGRFYPDDVARYEWFPPNGEVLLMGHTHYPLLRMTDQGGWLFNPGSVGQPRDGNPMPGWGLLDTREISFTLERSRYDNQSVQNRLKKMKWDERSIAALSKSHKGRLL